MQYMQGVTKQVSGWGGSFPVRNSFASYGPMGLVTISPRLYVGSWFLWYSFVLLGRRVSDGVRGSVCDHVGYKSGTVLIYSYALTGPAALYAPDDHSTHIHIVYDKSTRSDMQRVDPRVQTSLSDLC